MRIYLDAEACVGCGYCAAARPERFEMDGLKAVLRDGESLSRDDASGLAAVCPAGAVVAVDDEGDGNEAE